MADTEWWPALQNTINHWSVIRRTAKEWAQKGPLEGRRGRGKEENRDGSGVRNGKDAEVRMKEYIFHGWEWEMVKKLGMGGDKKERKKEGKKEKKKIKSEGDRMYARVCVCVWLGWVK